MATISAPITSFQANVRTQLTHAIANDGATPPNPRLASLCGCTEQQLDEAMRALQNARALALHPNSTRPWVVHPFSLYPSSCWVQCGRRGWWATCLYCAMGIVAATKNKNADIHTRFGGEAEVCVVKIRDGTVESQNSDVLFHLATPLREWWDNVVYACATFQPFHNEADVEAWCKRHRMKKGYVMTLPQLWRFASEWYGEYLDSLWRKRSAVEVQELLQKHGLVGEFWALT